MGGGGGGCYTLTAFLCISVYIIKPPTLNKCRGGQSKSWNNYGAGNADLRKHCAALPCCPLFTEHTDVDLSPQNKKKGREQKKQYVEVHKSLQKLSFIHQARI